GHLRIGEATLVRQELDDRYVALAVLLEARQVLGDLVGEGERPALDQEPDGAGRHDLRVRVQEPERVLRRRDPRGIEAGVADRLEQGELAPAGPRGLPARGGPPGGGGRGGR